MEKVDTRDTIISVGIDMISLQGYNATGIDSVLRKAGVPKGSFYHYFKSKEDFGLAIIDQFAEQYEERMRRFLNDAKVPPLDRIRNYMLDGKRWFAANDNSRGCMIGNLSQELADQNDHFRERLAKVLGRWKELFAGCIREAQEAGKLGRTLDAKVLAEFVLSGWEGALLRAKVTKSSRPIGEFVDVLFATVLKEL